MTSIMIHPGDSVSDFQASLEQSAAEKAPASQSSPNDPCWDLRWSKSLPLFEKWRLGWHDEPRHDSHPQGSRLFGALSRSSSGSTGGGSRIGPRATAFPEYADLQSRR